ncbi:conserved hypothetical protein [Bosea sp. 62]|uniref:DUF4054 domain-containing protein n=1 Tax=unclassified Bosea (in: a-proteobacteria) TaxID=2653178 RepID=UPI001257C5FF|nr:MULTISPECIES: DUF4054 domain-containing protein [unclassified Bosea (in: a-proteobacteria)]CAD5254349.1 conserved hypothetical protein [Bosea sp. 7B]CAD5276704.1 conserved hypothetical protein [Bosea sp. 21B]CAD5277851.1 conserved hypothetical protein [Bosea sp. 46]VVT59851.1 conserved hypothetical protein [Bosea sp. EC-HK365B]VXB46079.1 conserved hypothetical protein [Bosea sp. 62]
MTVTPASFREHFPEFADVTSYPDGSVSYWLGIGALMLRPDRWADLLDHGLELFTAHHIALAQQAVRSSASGAVPGANTGVVTGKTVDKVSVSYDAGSTTLDTGAGHWNATTYGVQFLQLARMAGSGGWQL